MMLLKSRNTCWVGTLKLIRVDNVVDERGTMQLITICIILWLRHETTSRDHVTSLNMDIPEIASHTQRTSPKSRESWGIVDRKWDNMVNECWKHWRQSLINNKTWDNVAKVLECSLAWDKVLSVFKKSQIAWQLAHKDENVGSWDNSDGWRDKNWGYYEHGYLINVL